MGGLELLDQTSRVTGEGQWQTVIPLLLPLHSALTRITQEHISRLSLDLPCK